MSRCVAVMSLSEFGGVRLHLDARSQHTKRSRELGFRPIADRHQATR